MDLSTVLGTYQLLTPLIAASGTVGSVVDFTDVVDFSLYGATTAKSVAPEPWSGRPPPRISPTEFGMLNGIGVQNVGIRSWLQAYGPSIPSVPCDVWGSIVAHDIDGFAAVASAMDGSGVKAIEINLSCPNLDGIPYALDPALSGDVVRSVRSATSLPISAKLSSDARPISAVAASVAEAGADWVVVSNTVMGASINPDTRRPAISGLIGGYSGGPIRPIAIRSVLEIARDLPGLPIVGCGGVSRAAHVIEFLLAGASAVALGSIHFRTPRIAKSITRDINRYMAKHDVTAIEQLIGAYEPW